MRDENRGESAEGPRKPKALLSCILTIPYGRSQSKVGANNEIIHPYFRKRSSVGQLKLRATEAEKEK